MRLPRPTTRRLMATVAVVGLLLGAVDWGRRLKRRRDDCLRKASNHTRLEKLCRAFANPRVDDGKVHVSSGGESTVSAPFSGIVLGDGHARPAAVLVQYHAELKK